MARPAEARVKVKISDDGSLKNIEKGSRQADRALKGAAQASSNTSKNFSKMSQGITGGLVPAYATLAANLFAITAVFGALKEAADLRVMREGMEAYASTTGQAMQSISRGLQEVTRMQLDYGESMKATATLTAAGFSADMIMEMGEAARNASSAIGHNFEDAFNRITKGIQKAEPELLDELGIVLRLDEATRKYGERVNKNQKDLTLYERTLAVHNEVIEQATQKYGQLDREIQVSGMNQMATAFSEIKKTALEGISPIAEFFAGTFTKHIKLVIISMALFAVSIMKAAGLGDMLKNKMNNALEQSASKAKAAKIAMQGYSNQLKQLNMSQEERGAMAEGGMAGYGKSERIMQGQTGKGANLLKAGRVDLIAKDKRILSNWSKAAKKHIGITKNMTNAERAEFEIWVNDLLLDHDTVLNKAKRTGKKIKLSWDMVWTGLKTGATGAFSMIGKGFGAVASGAMKLLSFMGWIGMLTMAVTMIKEFLANLDKLVESMIGWGKSLADMAENRFPRLAKAIRSVTKNLEEGTEAWREYRKEQRKLQERQDKLESINTSFEEGSKEINSILAGLQHDFEDTGHSVELFIKKMKLFESLNVGAALKAMGTEVRSNLDDYIKYVEEKTAIMGTEGFGEKVKTTYYVPAGELAAAPVEQMSYTARANELNTALSNTESNIEMALNKTGLDDYLVKIQSLLDNAALSGIDTSTVNISDAKAALDRFDKAIQEGTISPEFYRLMVLDVIGGLEDQWNSLSTNVIKPGKAMTALSQITESYNKELANLKQKSMPQAWGKIHSIFSQISKEIEGINNENLASSVVDDNTISLLEQMNIKLKEGMTIGELTEAISARQNKLREYAYGLAEKENTLKMNALDRPGAGVGSKLGGALGKDIKHFESIARFEDQITMNENKQVDLAKQKAELGMGEEEYTAQLNALKLQEKQLRKNLEVTEKAYSLQFKLANQFQMAFTTLFEEIAKGEKKIGDIFKDVTRQMLVQIAQMMAQMAAIAAMKAMFGATMFGVPIGGREGGVFNSPGYRSYAGGGVAEGPNSGYLATLHGREAVVPLGNDKSIPVKIRDEGGTSNSNITVNISTQGGQTTTSAGAGERERKLGQMVAAAVQGEILDQQRPGGLLSQYGDGDI